MPTRVKPGRAYGADGISGALTVRPKPGVHHDPRPNARRAVASVVRSNVDTTVTGYGPDGAITGTSVVPANRVPRILKTLARLSKRTVRVIVAWDGGTAEFAL